MEKNKILKTVIAPVVLVGLLVVGYFFIKNKTTVEVIDSGSGDFRLAEQKSSKPIIDSSNPAKIVGAKKIVFLRHNDFGSGKGGRVYKINYDGTEMEKINDDKVYNLAISPLFNNILYTSLDELNFDFGTKKYLTIKLSEFPNLKNIKKIAEYSLDDDLGVDNVSKFTTEFKWADNGKVLSFFLRLKQNLSEGDALFYIDENKASKEGNFVTNPFKDELSHYFDKIRRYKISPNGKFIALTLKEKGDRGLILYDIAKEDHILILEDVFSDEFFFDAKDNFYYSITGKYKSDQKWIKWKAETEISDIFYNKPDYWVKFLDAVFSSKLDKMAYVCSDYYKKVCVSSFDGQNKKSFSFNGANVSNIQDLFWGKDGNYLFFTASLNNEENEPFTLSLWIVDIEKDNVKKITDIEAHN